jgi:hypothetical protein
MYSRIYCMSQRSPKRKSFIRGRNERQRGRTRPPTSLRQVLFHPEACNGTVNSKIVVWCQWRVRRRPDVTRKRRWARPRPSVRPEYPIIKPRAPCIVLTLPREGGTGRRPLRSGNAHRSRAHDPSTVIGHGPRSLTLTARTLLLLLYVWPSSSFFR